MKKFYKKSKILQKTIAKKFFLWYYNYSDISLERRAKMEVKKIYNITQFLEDLERQGFEIFYTKGNDADSVKIYEDEKQVVYINYNYSYIDIITK